MIRKNLYLTEEQNQALIDLNEISVSEHIRRAIDEYIAKKQPKMSASPSGKLLGLCPICYRDRSSAACFHSFPYGQ